MERAKEYSEKRKRMRANLRLIQAHFNMTPKQRVVAIIEEQKKKFEERGGRVKQLQPGTFFDNGSYDPIEAIDFLRG